jgi:PBSX family phage portal protein
MYVNVTHARCVRTKVQDSVGIGYRIEPTDDSSMDDKEKDSDYKLLTDFFSLCNNKNEDLVAVLKKVMIDYEGCGNGYIEVSRGKDNMVNGLYHVNATSLRWAKDKERIIQRVGNKYVWFKKFGEERVLDRFTGQWASDSGISDIDKIANEIIPITKYSWLSSVYGVPEWLPALFSMYGDKMEQEYNIDFFLNYGVPAYALIVEGDSISNEVLEEVEKFFATTLKGSNHKMLTLATQAGVTLKFERLSVEQKEASFRVYKKDNRDSILTAHNVPPYRASIVEQGALGGSVAEETDRIYLDSVINPIQREFAWVINEFIIKRGLEITGWTLQFDDINISDAKQESEIVTVLVQTGILTPNEARKRMGMEPYDGGDVFYVGGQLVPVGGEDLVNPSGEDNPPDEGLTPEQKRGEAEVDFPTGERIKIGQRKGKE